MTDRLTYEDLALPNYLNTRRVFANLTVSDLARAAVLAPMNMLLVGNTGSGKTQLAKDIYNNWFGGNQKENGHGIFIRAHPDVDIYNEIFTELNMEKAQRVLTDNIESQIYLVDEINRAPPIAQNQFFGLGDGVMDYRGKAIKLGRHNYHMLLATANIGNGEFQGTFESDKALYNRLHVALDLDFDAFRPTEEDEYKLDRKKADPNVKEARIRDITDKLMLASQEVGALAEDVGLEALAALNYLRFGLRNCQRNTEKDKAWPMECQDCSFNQNGSAVCSFIRDPVRRTTESVRRYAAALQYLIQLKDPKEKINATDLIFKSFELTGAYQSLINPHILRTTYKGNNPKFMAEIMSKLREDYAKNQGYIMASLFEAERGKTLNVFFEDKKTGQIGNFEELPEKVKAKVQKIEPYSDSREIGMSWAHTFTLQAGQHYAEVAQKKAQEEQTQESKQ